MCACVRACVCVRASSVNRVNCIGHYPSREPAQKRSRLCCFLPQPRVQEHNSEHERWDSRLLLFELYKQANCEAKRPFFSFFYFFFLYRSRPIPVSCVQLCTGTCTNLYSLRFTRTRDFAEVKRYLVLSCAQSAQLVARHSLASPVNVPVPLVILLYTIICWILVRIRMYYPDPRTVKYWNV